MRIIHKLDVMSLTVARNERVRNVLTHASFIKFNSIKFNGVVVSKTFIVINNFFNKK